MFACVHWLAAESRARICFFDPFHQESWKEDVYFFQGGQGKVSSEHFHGCGKNIVKTVFSKVIILYINHSAQKNMLSIHHSYNTHRDGKERFVMRQLAKSCHNKICLFIVLLLT